MDIGELFERLWRHRRAALAGLVVATLAGFLAVFRVEAGVPPRVHERQLETGAGIAQLALDSARAPILKAGVPLDGLTDRAAVLTDFVQSPPVVRRISKSLGVPVEEIGTRGAPPAGLSRGREIEADQRATELTAESAPYRIYAASSPDAPVITLYTRAPEPRRAVQLAQAATAALIAYVHDSESRKSVPPLDRVQVRPLGAPQAKWVNRGARFTLAFIAFVGAAAAWALVVALARRVSRSIAVERSATAPAHEDDPWLARSTGGREIGIATTRFAERRGSGLER